MSGDIPSQRLTGPALDKWYEERLASFSIAVERAIISSHQATGLDAGPQRFWGSVLLTKICTTSVSILWLSPRSVINPDGLNWDFSSIASLARNLFESSLVFFYLATEVISTDEWDTRLLVFQLHDHVERHRMSSALNGSSFENPQDLPASDLRKRLIANPWFAGLAEGVRNNLLNGNSASILSKNEICQRMGYQGTEIWGFYKYWSSQAHTLPIGIYRTAEHNRNGEESESEKAMIATALELCQQIVERVSDDFQNSFRGLVTFTKARYDWSLLRRAGAPMANINHPQTGHEAICPCGSKRKFRWCHGLPNYR